MTNDKGKERAFTVQQNAVAMTFYLMPDDLKRLKIIATMEGKSLQTLVMDALDMLLERQGMKPLERWSTRLKNDRDHAGFG